MREEILCNPTESASADSPHYLPLGDSILASWIRSICQTTRGYGIDPIPVLERAGLDPDLLNVPEARYPTMYVRRFWDLVVEAVGDNLFGLRCGAEMQPAALHGLGLAVITSHSLAQVLELITVYSRVISSTMDLALVHSQGTTKLTVRTLHGSETHHSATLTLLALIARQARNLSQHDVRPTAVYLADEDWTPHERRRMEEYFGSPVILDERRESGIEFAYPDVVEPYASANAVLREANERVIKTYLRKVHRNSYAVRVEEELGRLLEDGESIKMTTVADALNLSPRTLQRRLDAEGVTFADVLDRYRKQIAHDALAHTEKSITEIAYSVGFSDLSNFSRKCYSWFGSSPVVYRKRIRQLQS